MAKTTITTEKLAEQLTTAENGRQSCSLCGLTIPADVKRVSFEFRGQFGSSAKRVCGLCIIRMASKLQNDKAIETWAMEVSAGLI